MINNQEQNISYIVPYSKPNNSTGFLDVFVLLLNKYRQTHGILVLNENIIMVQKANFKCKEQSNYFRYDGYIFIVKNNMTLKQIEKIHTGVLTQPTILGKRILQSKGEILIIV